MMAQAHPVIRRPPVRTYDHVKLRPLTGFLGCEIQGVDLNAIRPGQLAEIRQAFADHLVVVFRDQHDLTREAHLAFAAHFGEILMLPHFPSVPGFPGIGLVHRDADDRRPYFGEGFHCDSTFLDRPPTAVVMRAAKLPPVGGDTCFSNLCVAYDSLSSGMRAMLDSLRLVHGDQHILEEAARRSRAPITEQPIEVVHPLVVEHPVTGRRALFINPLLSLRFEGMTESESAPMLGYLLTHLSFMPFTARVSWQPGMVVLWDNWAAAHSAIGDYQGFTRTMERVTLCGARPDGPAGEERGA